MNLGWFLIPLILLGSSLMVAVACVLNNIQRKFPVYWWTPVDLSRQARKGNDVEKGEGKERIDDGISYDVQESEKSLIVIDASNVSVPDWISLDGEETAMLEVLRLKLQEGLGVSNSRDSEATRVHEPGSEVHS